MDTEILDRLLLLNPWFRHPPAFATECRRHIPQPFVARRLALEDALEARRACLVVGPRQVGKSSLVWSGLQSMQPDQVLVLQAEEPLVRRWAQSPVQVVHDIESEFPTVRRVFVEEAQQLDEAGLFIKGLVDAHRDWEIVVTGSSSYHLLARTRESLAGRAIRRQLLPLTLGELVDFEAPAVPAVRTQLERQVAARQQILGAYPGVWFHPEPERHLGDLVEAFVLRDASDRFAIRDPQGFRRLLVFAAGQVGQMMNYSEWATNLGVSAATVRAWVGLLEETWVLRQVPAFAGGRRNEITAAGRVHFYDLGIRNALLSRFEPALERRADRGALAEGWVFTTLAKVLPRGWDIHYWRSKGGAEVDFVLVGGDRLVGVEVKASGRQRVTRSLRSFVEAYQPELVMLVAGFDGGRREERLDRTRLLHIPLTDLERAIEEHLAPVA
ncbi:MAG: ATP-binding protein [Deltaproteobacteria bacterium]|nr:ATP-binding protein [Deltaproteobacteria bacterium]